MNLFLYEQSFKNSGIAQALFDDSWALIDVNGAYADFYGYTHQEIMQKTVNDLIHEDDWEIDSQQLSDIGEGTIKYYQIKKRYKHKNGDLLWGLLTVSRLEDPDGESVYYLAQVHDLKETVQLEQKLEQKNDLSVFLMKHSSDLITVHTPDGKITYSSAYVSEVGGYEENELSGKYYSSFLHPEDLPLLINKHQELLENRTAVKAMYRFLTNTGNYVWFESITRAACNSENNDVIEIITNSREITNRLEMEKEILETNKRKEEMLNSIRDGFLLLDNDFNLAYINGIAEERSRSYGNIPRIGESIFSIFPDLQEVTFPKHVNKSNILTQPLEFEFFWNSRADWYSVTVTPSSEGIFIHSNIVTSYKEALFDLADSEDRYRKLVETCPDAVVVHKGKAILYANERALDLFEAVSYEQLVNAGMRELFKDLIKSNEKDEGNSWNDIIHSSVKTKTLKNRMIELETTSLRIMFDGKAATHSLLRDVTEKRNLEQMFHKSEKLAVVGELAAAFAHEVRNPLTSIKGFLQLVHSLKEYNEEYMEIALNELRRVEAIIFEFLSLAKPHEETRFERVDIKEIIRQVVSLLKSQALMKNQLLDYLFSSEPVYVECEPNLMKQVLINVIKNGLESLEEKGGVKLYVSKVREELAVITIEDNGCGIPQEKIVKLGEPFYSTKDKGTGLGLMTSMKIIENHDGFFKIESEVHIGTKISIVIPLKKRCKGNNMLVSPENNSRTMI